MEKIDIFNKYYIFIIHLINYIITMYSKKFLLLTNITSIVITSVLIKMYIENKYILIPNKIKLEDVYKFGSFK